MLLALEACLATAIVFNKEGLLDSIIPDSHTGGRLNRMLEGDFDWDINLDPLFPQIAFDDATEQSEVVFLYNFTGIVTAEKYLDVKLYQKDCETRADDTAITFRQDFAAGEELQVDIDIVQETISESVHYTENPSGLSAIIDFCVRVDYFYDVDGRKESINFHETKVTIDVSLVANFTLTTVSIDRTGADAENANANLDYPVEAYICGNDNVEILDPPALTQGSMLQFCVRMDNELVQTENVFVEDILVAILSQPGGVGDNLDSVIVTNTNPDALSEKVCRDNGICNVKSQLPSKYFVAADPKPLRVDGVAILSLGKASMMPSASPTQAPGGGRRLRVPIRGLIRAEDTKSGPHFQSAEQRKLQGDVEAAVAETEADGGAAASPFGNLEVEVTKVVEEVCKDCGISAQTVIIIFIVCIAISLFLTCLCCFGCNSTKKTIEEKKIILSEEEMYNNHMMPYPMMYAPSVMPPSSNCHTYPESDWSSRPENQQMPAAAPAPQMSINLFTQSGPQMPQPTLQCNPMSPTPQYNQHPSSASAFPPTSIYIQNGMVD